MEPDAAPEGRRALAHVSALAAGPPLDPQIPVTVSFHPDRSHRGTPILVGMARAGCYLSQFVTGTSNGGLTAHPDGDRWRWESRIFGGAYDQAPPERRPVYGALNHLRRPVGGSPRFGSAHLRLAAGVRSRTTFCYPDSYREPADFAVAGRFALLDLLERDAAALDPLDRYVEAQVHGPVRFAEHVDALVLDPCYCGTEVEEQARELGCPVEWHRGFRLSVEALREHPGYREPGDVELGARLAVDGRLTPREIGGASRSGRHDGQALKRVWHHLACFGAPDSPADPGPQP
jgi:hypothetical protein